MTIEKVRTVEMTKPAEKSRPVTITPIKLVSVNVTPPPATPPLVKSPKF